MSDNGHWDSDEEGFGENNARKPEMVKPQSSPNREAESFEREEPHRQFSQRDNFQPMGRQGSRHEKSGGGDNKGPRKCCRCPEDSPHRPEEHYRLFFAKLPSNTEVKDIENGLSVRAEKVIVFKSGRNGFALFGSLQDAFEARTALNQIDGFHVVFCKDCEEVLKDLNLWDDSGKENQDSSTDRFQRSTNGGRFQSSNRQDRNVAKSSEDRGPRKCCNCPAGSPHKPEAHYRLFFAKLPPDTQTRDIEGHLTVTPEKVVVFKSGRNGFAMFRSLEDAFSAKEVLRSVDGYHVIFCKDCEEILKDLNEWEESGQQRCRDSTRKFGRSERAKSPPCDRQNSNSGSDDFSSRGKHAKFGRERRDSNNNDTKGPSVSKDDRKGERKCCKCPDDQAHDPQEHYEIFFAKIPSDTQVQDVEALLDSKPKRTVIFKSGKNGFARFESLNDAFKAKDQLNAADGFFTVFCRPCETVLKDLGVWTDSEYSHSGRSKYAKQPKPNMDANPESQFGSGADVPRIGSLTAKWQDACSSLRKRKGSPKNSTCEEYPSPKVPKMNNPGNNDNKGWESEDDN